MRYLYSLFLLLLLLPPGVTLAREPLRVLSGVVVKVSDGDTVHVQTDEGSKVKVRLYGIDAPETPKVNRRKGTVSKLGQPYGEEAAEALTSKVLRQRVRLEVIAVDRYRRSVSFIYLDGRYINREMVTEGYAWAYKQYLDRPYASEFIGEEEKARAERRGLWREDNPIPPWEFRKQLRRGD